MNIAFYFNNSGIPKQDYSKIRYGNPGIGGTQYAMILLATLLAEKKYKNKKFYFFAESIYGIPESLNVKDVSTLAKLSQQIDNCEIDILVVNKGGKNTLDKRFFSAIKNNNVKIIIWDHCFIPYFDLLSYARNKKVARIVTVGKEQLMTFCDHKAFKKSTYIYNLCNYCLPPIMPFANRKNNVVYIGSIVPLKGLHLLTKAWPKIIKNIPDAQLYIIGSGKLYNKNAQLGEFGIAEYFYEKELLKPILNEEHKIISSVHFLGIMGDEKFEIMNNAKLVVPNPSGLTETFGYTAIEAQLSGCLVTTKKCPGYLDTVFNHENLYDKVDDLSDFVINLLKKTDYDPSYSINYVKNKFSSEKILSQWMELFDDVFLNKSVLNKEVNTDFPPSKRKIINAKLQKYICFLPSLMLYEMFLQKIKYFLLKMFDLKNTIKKFSKRKLNIPF